jgi:hypothetical protein
MSGYGFALSGFAGPRCMGCAGLIDKGDYVMVWALLSADSGPFFLEITRKVRRVLDVYPRKGLRAHVRRGFPQGARWVTMLGFRCIEENVLLPEYADKCRVDVYERDGANGVKCP